MKNPVSPYDHSAARAERWALRSVVARLLPFSPTASCSLTKNPGIRGVAVFRSQRHQRAFVSGVYRCASVWCCPICSAKISERRRVRIQTACDEWQSQACPVFLFTGTFPHGLGDDLPAILSALLSAWRKTTDTRQGRAARLKSGILGTVRSVEITYGRNGWHPHIHALLFMQPNSPPPYDVELILREIWQNSCIAVGLPMPSDDHGLRIDSGDMAGSYLSKSNHWGKSSEVVRSYIKSSRVDSITPWDMLRLVFSPYINSRESRKYEQLFIDYARAFQGKRQLFASKFISQFIAMASDAALANDSEDKADLLAEITERQWKILYERDLQPYVLNLAESNPAAMSDFLHSLT
ncbi:MAG: protein rep [Candidatus Methylumidiphilus sp.]